MRGAITLAAALAAALAPSPADALVRPRNPSGGNPNHPYRNIVKRGITGDPSEADGKAFDFVIAGGGVAGLTLAGRLSEWSNVTVLVIEAGESGDAVEQQIDVPGMAYTNGLTKSAYDWQYETVSQAQAGSETKSWPRGKVLGGSGAINGMFWGRAGSEEYDAWATLNPNGNTTWDWEEVNKYIMKSESHSAPPAGNQERFQIPSTASYHGSDGPIKTGYSAYIFDWNAAWIPSWVALGFTAKDLAGGDTHGVTITPSTLDQDAQVRSDSKSGYIDPNTDRPNLVVLTGQQVTKVLFNGTKDADGNLIASGVQFSANGGTFYSVQANKEVLLAGGVVGSAQILQLSGIGPSSVLQSAGVDLLYDLPVGYNLQDHVSYTMYFSTGFASGSVQNWNAFMASDAAKTAALDEWTNNQNGTYTYINEAVGYVSMGDIAGGASAATTFANGVDVSSIVSTITTAYDLPASVQSGLTDQLNIQKTWLSDNTGQLEIIYSAFGTDASSLGIQIALQHPFSRGTLFINSNSAFSKPTIDPGYLAIQQDADILQEGSEWVRTLAKTAPMSDTLTNETGGTTGLTGSALTTYIRGAVGTEYHPLGTCSMLPQDKGGVVDTELIVYGTSNLRVIDSAIMPMQISAHLMASTYGIAEKGADIIKDKYMYRPPPPSPSSNATSAAALPPQTTAEIGVATDSSVADAKKEAASSPLSSGAKIGIGVGVGAGAGLILGAIVFWLFARNKKKPAADEKGWYAGANNNNDGAWDAQAAYRDADAFPLQRPARPFSSAAASVSTMATADLQHGIPGSPSASSYQMGDYQRGGGATSPFRDMEDHSSGYNTPDFHTPQHFSNVRPS